MEKVDVEEEEADRIALERRRIELDRARIAREQFAKYDFPKEVEKLLSNLVEAEDRLSRTRKRTASAEAKSIPTPAPTSTPSGLCSMSSWPACGHST